jgi:hypothetical protein
MARPPVNNLDDTLVEIIRRLNREGYAWLYPWQIEAWLDVPRSERQIRRDMARLCQAGRLQRQGRRGGYRSLDASRPARGQDVAHPERLTGWRGRGDR